MPRWTSWWTTSSPSPTLAFRWGNSREGVDDGPGDERQVGEAEALLGLEPVLVARRRTRSTPSKSTSIDVKACGEVCLRPHHVLAGAATDVVERDSTCVARAPRRGRGRPGWAGAAAGAPGRGRGARASGRRGRGVAGAAIAALDAAQDVVAGDAAAGAGALRWDSTSRPCSLIRRRTTGDRGPCRSRRRPRPTADGAGAGGRARARARSGLGAPTRAAGASGACGLGLRRRAPGPPAPPRTAASSSAGASPPSSSPPAGAGAVAHDGEHRARRRRCRPPRP